MGHSQTELDQRRPKTQSSRWRGHSRTSIAAAAAAAAAAAVDDRQKSASIKHDETTPPKQNMVLYPTSFRTPNVPSSTGWRIPPGAPVKASPRSSRATSYRNGQTGGVEYPQILPPWQSAPRTEIYSSSSPSCSILFPHYPVMATPKYGATARQMGSTSHIIPMPSTPKRSLGSSKTAAKMSMTMAGVKPSTPSSSSSSYVLYRKPSSLATAAAAGLTYERVGLPHFNAFRVKLPPHLVQDNLDRIVAHAEAHAKTLSTGWKTELYSLTKCDMACRDIPGLKEYLRPVFEYVCQAIQILYGSQKLVIDKNQPHILKYSAAMGHTGGEQNVGWCLALCMTFAPTHKSLFPRTQHAVELHHDRCDVTANLALSNSYDYEGGGTMLVDVGRVVKLEKGEFLLHPGSLVHGGIDITKGTRYLLVTFAHLK